MDSTARYLANVYDKLPPDDGRLLLQFAEFLIEKQPRVISAREARRQASVWLVREVGNLLMGGQPEFVPGDQPAWQVPIIVAGRPDQPAGSILVDARSGELLVNESTPGQILSHVQLAISRTTSN